LLKHAIEGQTVTNTDRQTVTDRRTDGKECSILEHLLGNAAKKQVL